MVLDSNISLALIGKGGKWLMHARIQTREHYGETRGQMQHDQQFFDPLFQLAAVDLLVCSNFIQLN